MPTASAAQDRVSPATYLAGERASGVKHELWRGDVFAMAGASYAVSRIVANLVAALRDALAGGPCRALPSDMKVHVPSREAFVYPDASIVCGPPSFYDPAQDVLTNPAAVFEVLSESTERFDRGEKFVGYRSIPSLRECVLVSQHERLVEHYVRSPDGTWVLHEHAGEGAVALACGGRLDLAALYLDTGA
jgi:Uma2 family endonuclease